MCGSPWGHTAESDTTEWLNSTDPDSGQASAENLSSLTEQVEVTWSVFSDLYLESGEVTDGV